MIKITRIHVENFRSIRECTFEMRDIQLLIGPNNSGKTNLLRVFEFLSEVTNYDSISEMDIVRIRHKHKHQFGKPVAVTVEMKQDEDESIVKFHYYRIELLDFYRHPSRSNSNIDWREVSYNELLATRQKFLSDSDFKRFNLANTKEIIYEFEEGVITRNKTIPLEQDATLKNVKQIGQHHGSYFIEFSQLHGMNVSDAQVLPGQFMRLPFWTVSQNLKAVFLNFSGLIQNLRIYRVDPLFVRFSAQIKKHDWIESNGQNIVAYLENLHSSDPEAFNLIKKGLRTYLPDFVDINFETIEAQENQPAQRRLRLKDKYGVNHRTEDISEGTLYFLIILSIVMQPNMPSILMIEEPETGIHPRRISEILEHLFKLRESKSSVPIIITTHHPYVVDHFSEIPESIWVFDSEEGETKIKNLLNDIIKPENEKMEKEGMDPINYTESLGEHWAMGFLGGVPETVKR